MNGSAVLLMLSTVLIRRAVSDDEILGHVAPELGYDLYWRRTAQARRALELYRTQGVGTPLGQKQALEELARIEFECDAFSAVTLASLGRHPLFFGHYLEATERSSEAAIYDFSR
jgi:phosphoribosylaminoimidazole (AIR) synthetase